MRFSPRRALAVLVSGSALGGAAALPAMAQAVASDPADAPAGTYTLDPAHTSVTMKVSHLGLSFYTLRFGQVSGGYAFDPSNPGGATLQVAVDPASVQTGDAALDRQIASQVFDAGRYPTIAFVSTAVRPGEGAHGQVAGRLTFHGQTRPVSLDVIYNGSAKGEHGAGTRMGFSATATIRRSEFGAGAYLPAVGDEVTVLIEAEATR